MEELITISYDRSQKEAVSAMLVTRTSKDTIEVINELYGKEADTIYGILNGSIKLSPEQPLYFAIPERKTTMKRIYRDQPYTVSELCKDTGISQGSIIEYINGKRSWENMTIKTFKKIADYSGMSMNQLYNEINSTKKILDRMDK